MKNQAAQDQEKPGRELYRRSVARKSQERPLYPGGIKTCRRRSTRATLVLVIQRSLAPCCPTELGSLRKLHFCERWGDHVHQRRAPAFYPPLTICPSFFRPRRYGR